MRQEKLYQAIQEDFKSTMIHSRKTTENHNFERPLTLASRYIQTYIRTYVRTYIHTYIHKTHKSHVEIAYVYITLYYSHYIHLYTLAAHVQRRGHIFAMLEQVRRICAHPLCLDVAKYPAACKGLTVAHGVEASGKTQRLVELLEEIVAAKEKAVVFATRKQVISALIELSETRCEALCKSIDVMRMYIYRRYIRSYIYIYIHTYIYYHE